MTQVLFAFRQPDGTPLAGAGFTVQMRRPGLIPGGGGVIVPDTLSFVTGPDGTVIADLQPSTSVYLLVLAEGPDTCTGVRYKFYVPDSDAVIDAEDLYLAPPPKSEPWDETAIQMLTDAKVAAIAAATEAGLSADAAELSAAEAAASAEAAAAVVEGVDLNADRAERARDASEAFAIDALAARTGTSEDRIAARQSAIDAANAGTVAAALEITKLGEPDGANKIGGKRLGLVEAIKYGLQTLASAGAPTLWDYAHLVTNRPNVIDYKTWDWHPALQAAIDFGGPVLLPADAGTLTEYLTSACLQVRWNRRTSLFGPPGDRPLVRIRTTKTFTDRSMIRQWDQSFYAAGETNQDERPVDFSAYSARVDRYLNLRWLEFYIDSDAGGEVTCVDMVSMQETARFDGLLFNGATAIEKGWPIRIRTGGGGEVSMNGAVLSNIVVYGQRWRGELKAIGSGSDLRINGWVTSNSDHKEAPFQFGIIGTVLRDLHCEAYSTGNPTFDITGTDIRIVDPPVLVIRNGQGDVIRVTDPAGTGAGKYGAVMTSARVYPSGGNSSNVTNLASINLYNDTSRPGLPVVIPLAVGGQVPGMVVSLSRAGAVLIGPSGVPRVYDFTPGAKTGYIAYIPPSGNLGTQLIKDSVITVTDPAFKLGMVDISWSAGTASGTAGADYFNNPQSGRITLHSSFNGSETRRKARLYTDGAPALFSNPVWDVVAGTLSLTVLINCTNLKMITTYVQ